MVQRRFIVGSEWMYFKIYSGAKTIEQLFIYDIVPLLNSLLKLGLIDSYHFVRYMDPDYHIRLRLHCQDTDNYGRVLNFFNKKLDKYVRNLTITKVQMDTYNRELERYGGNRIVYFEKFFFYDSCLISKCLKRLDCADEHRYKITMRFIDSLLDKSGFNIDKKISFVNRNRMAYFQEIYQSDSSVKVILDSKYRAAKNDVFSCFDINGQQKQNWWNADISKCINKIMVMPHNFLSEKENELTSVIHMHINRMFRTKQRTVELLIYWYLHKYYTSHKARISSR